MAGRKKKATKKYNHEDEVNHPAHYQGNKIEVIEFLEDHFADRPHEWNVVKYLARARKKGKELQDLEKGLWYLERRIHLLKVGAGLEKPRRPNDLRRK